MINFYQPSFFAYKAPKLYDLTFPITDIRCFGSKWQNNPSSLFLQERNDFYWFVRNISPPYLVWVTFSFKKVLLGHFVAQWCVTVFLVLDVSSVDTQHISSTPILGLCQGVFTDQFIFRLILGPFIRTSYTFYATGETRSITSHITCNTKMWSTWFNVTVVIYNI